MNYDNLKKDLNSFLINLNEYNGVGDLLKAKPYEEIKEYWDVVELCREIKKKMEGIYERY